MGMTWAGHVGFMGTKRNAYRIQDFGRKSRKKETTRKN
jgi:hypothetical protein